MNERYKTSWYNSPRLMLGLFLLGAWNSFILIPAVIVFALHYKNHHAMLRFAQNAEEREQKLKEKEFAADDIIRKAKVEANQLISQASSQKTALEIEMIELKKEISALTSQIIEKTNQIP